jgi:hypothetical protein
VGDGWGPEGAGVAAGPGGGDAAGGGGGVGAGGGGGVGAGSGLAAGMPLGEVGWSSPPHPDRSMNATAQAKVLACRTLMEMFRVPMRLG